MHTFLLLISALWASPPGELLNNPTQALPGLYLGSYEQALERSAALSPVAQVWPALRWLRYRVPDPAAGRPAWISIGWNAETDPDNPSHNWPRNTVFEYDWSSTKLAGNAGKQLKKLGVQIESSVGTMGGACPMEGLVFTGRHTATWIVIRGGDVVALFDDDYELDECIVGTTKELLQATEGALARGDAALLRRLRPDLALLASFDESIVGLLRTVDQELPIIETIPSWAGPSAAEALAAWRTFMDRNYDASALDRTRLRRTTAYALLAEARTAEPRRAILLRDFAWEAMHAEDGKTIDTSMLAFIEKELPRIPELLRDESSTVWSRYMEWVEDEARYGIGEPHPGGAEGAARDLIAVWFWDDKPEHIVKLVRARQALVQAIHAHADRFSQSSEILRQQARSIQRVPILDRKEWNQGHMTSTREIEDTVKLLALWQSGPPSPEQRLAYLGLDLPDDPFLLKDPEIRGLLAHRIQEAEAHGLLATAAGLRTFLGQAGEEVWWTPELARPQAPPSLGAHLARLVESIFPRHDPQDPFHAPDLANTAWRFGRVGGLRLGKAFYEARLSTPMLRVVVGEVRFRESLEPRVITSTERATFQVVSTTMGNEAGTAADAKSALDRDIFFLENEVARLRSIGNVVSSTSSFTGSVTGTTTSYSGSGTATTSPTWQGYTRTYTSVDRSATTQADALERELRLLKARYEELGSRVVVDQQHTSTETRAVEVPVQIQQWSADAMRDVWLVWDGGQAHMVQSGRHNMEFRRRPANPYAPAYDEWIQAESIPLRLAMYWDRGISTSGANEAMIRATEPGRRAWIEAGAARGWTAEQQTTERAWLDYWFDTSESLPEGILRGVPR